MKKIYRKLIKEQIERGIVFSSCLSENYSEENNTVHEVHKDDKEREEKIKRLLDDSFFNNSHFNYNIVRR